MDSNGIRRHQWELLKRLLDHAYRNVPFYRRRFDEAGVTLSDLAGFDDLRRLPILTRNNVRDNLDDLVASNVDRSTISLVNTGGSTGQPVGCYKSVDFMAYQKAVVARSLSWAGAEEGDKRAVIWGADRDLPHQSLFQRFRSRFILRERWLNAYNLTEDKMRTFAHTLIEWKPTFIVGYARAVYLFALFLEENGLDRIRPTAVWTSAETLFEYQRTVIEGVFGCKVFNSYGSREVAAMAAECQAHQGLHVLSDSVYIELLHDGRPAMPGEVGEIIVTPLNNFATPFIRYQIGDLARGSDATCSCGRPFPLLTEIVGRSNDVLSTPNGQIVHGAFFNHLLFDFEEIEEFQVHQRSLSNLTISLKCRATLSDENIQLLRHKVTDHMGPGVEVDFKTVDTIPLTATGKHRYMISDVPPTFVSVED